MATFSRAAFNATAYQIHRPVYTNALYKTILRYHVGQTKIALDLATGTGKAAVVLANHFDQVQATDASETMLASALTAPNVTYQIGSAEKIAREDSSVDMVTVAQAAHWFQRPAFFSETHRVLRPGGTLAIWGYGMPFFPGRIALSSALSSLCTETLADFWDEGRVELDNLYPNIQPPQPPFTDVRRIVWDTTRLTQLLMANTKDHAGTKTHSSSLTGTSDEKENAEISSEDSSFLPVRQLTLLDLSNYIKTWSAYANWRRLASETMPDPVDAFIQKAETLLREDGDLEIPSNTNDIDKGDASQLRVSMTWENVLILARK